MANAVCPASVLTTPPAAPRTGPATARLAGLAPTAPNVRGACGCLARMPRAGLRSRLLSPVPRCRSPWTHLDSFSSRVNHTNTEYCRPTWCRGRSSERARRPAPRVSPWEPGRVCVGGGRGAYKLSFEHVLSLFFLHFSIYLYMVFCPHKCLKNIIEKISPERAAQGVWEAPVVRLCRVVERL